MILTTAQTAYIYFVEGQTIFIGKRKTYAKRVETEHIRVESRTVAPRYSSMRIGVKSPGNAPNYELGMSYIRLTNGGKTLIHKVIRSFAQLVKKLNFFWSEQRDIFGAICDLLRRRGQNGYS